VKRLLLTGATGFIGAEVLQQIRRDTWDVHAVSRHAVDDVALDLTWHETDLLDARAVNALLANVKPSHLLHLAWDSGVADYRTTPRNLDWLAAGVTLARTFRAHGGWRAVFAGTCAEYQRDLSLYATCKAALADAVSAYARSDGWHFAWGRIYWPYGPRGATHRLVPYVIERLLSGEVARCSPGVQTRDFVHVSDVASGLLALLESASAGPIDIGTGEGTRVRTLVESIAEQIGRQELLRFDGATPPAGEPDVVVASPAALRSIGWCPRPLSEGLAQTIAWYRERTTA
jgi:nucleoside-diphosphate-sugar epimerase